MSLPVVLKSGRNYMTLVLDPELDFAELLQYIISKFLESEKFFGDEAFALMFDGRELSDREKLIILDAIEEYTTVNITRIIENDVYREYAAEKEAYDKKKADKDLNMDLSNDNCLYIDRDVLEGEKINASGNIVVYGDVHSGAILKAGANIIVLGRLEGQAIAGNDDTNYRPYIIATEFCPENFRIGRILGKSNRKKNKGFNIHRKASAKIAKLIDGEIQINNFK